MKAPQPIPYQGSKRALAPLIISFFPEKVKRLVEPFGGSAAISIASAMRGKAEKYLINDLNIPLIQLIQAIVNEPHEVADKYEKLWNDQLGREKQYYLEIRDKFNETHRSDYFLYILARCVKGAVRYNSSGEFNQSADNRRKGKRPLNMRKEIIRTSNLLKGITEFSSRDYSQIFHEATKEDLIYMDPPYQGTSKNKDPRYLSGIDFSEFVNNLDHLNKKDVPFLISYDGKTGQKEHGEDLPKELKLHKILIEVGRSTTSTLLGSSEITYESLYLSHSLCSKIEYNLPKYVSLKPKQLELL